jgi:methyltransferase (TIGR00027 family)
MTAAARAREGARDDRLFEDPWAATLAGEEGFAFLDAQDATFPGGRSPQSFVVRHRFFDDYLLSQASAGLRQVVLVAAGLDTRAFRLAWPPGIRVFELDQPAVLAYKDKLLADVGAIARCERRTVAVDLREDWPAELIGAGFSPTEPAVWLAEGLLFYLPEEAVHALLSAMAELSLPGSALGTDTMSAATLAHESRRGWVRLYADAGAPFIFGVDEPGELLVARGWQPTLSFYPEVSQQLGRAWQSPLPTGPQSAIITATRMAPSAQ